MNNNQKEELLQYYKNLLILQYNKEGGTARATIDLLVRQVLGALIAQQVQDAFNIDTAIGAQLDILGKYLGVERSKLSYPQLSDEQFRIVLKFAILKNNNLSSTEAISDSLEAFFGNEVTITDNKNMTIRYNIGGNISEQIIDILVSKKLLPKPMGVKVEILHKDAFFGFYGSNLQTFDNGIFYDPEQPIENKKTLIVTCDEPFATIIINGQQTSLMKMEVGTNYTWSVSKLGYNTVSGSGTVGVSDINILVHVLNVNITPTPDLLELNGNDELQGLLFEAGTTLTYNIYAEKDGYNYLEIDGTAIQTETITETMPELTPLCFTAEVAGSRIGYKQQGRGYFQKNIKYSTDMINWNTLAKDTDIVLQNVGDTVYFKGNNTSLADMTDVYPSYNRYSTQFTMSGKIRANGNVNSLLDDGDGSTISTIPTYCYWYLFYNCTALTRAPILSALSVGDNSYQMMFQNCTSLERMPSLPATSLAHYCYNYMFAGCTSLVYITKQLPATTLAEACYRYMFNGCTSLLKTLELPASIVETRSYEAMFSGCASLTKINQISATSLSQNSCFLMFENCTSLTEIPLYAISAEPTDSGSYQAMFNGCTALITVPQIPIFSNLTRQCFAGMFANCTSLTNVPDLINPTLSDSCYMNMFMGCTSLVKAPKILANTLEETCLLGMFRNCTSLTQPPELPWTTLTQDCFSYMFENCTSLTQAPDLPATVLQPYCYSHMFDGCLSLESIKLTYTGNFTTANNEFTDWVKGVAASGTIYYNGADTTTGDSAIPTGWTVQNFN